MAPPPDREARRLGGLGAAWKKDHAGRPPGGGRSLRVCGPSHVAPTAQQRAPSSGKWTRFQISAGICRFRPISRELARFDVSRGPRGEGDAIDVVVIVVGSARASRGCARRGGSTYRQSRRRGGDAHIRQRCGTQRPRRLSTVDGLSMVLSMNASKRHPRMPIRTTPVRVLQAPDNPNTRITRVPRCRDRSAR